MQALVIALKDVRRAFQSPFGVLNMLVLPLVITGVFYAAFGGFTSETPVMPATRVIVVNQDQGGTGFSAGQVIAEVLRDEQLADLLTVSESDDPAAARYAVDHQQAGVAVIIPRDLSRVLEAEGATSRVVIYCDPTLSVGPSIVREIVTGLVDGMMGSKILSDMVIRQFEAEGQTVTGEMIQSMIARYVSQVTPKEGEEAQRAGLLAIESPPGRENAIEGGEMILASMMVGMMVFYAFFTGANSAESILREEEERTLQRLFTTPTSSSTVYLGKLLYITLMILGQLIILHIASALAFDIRWPSLGGTALLIVGLVIASAGFGLFWMSLARTRGQAGAIIGGVFTVAGMLGGCFTSAIPNMPAFLGTVALFLPHGWAMRGWRAMLQGDPTASILLPVGIMMAMGLTYFGVGTLRFRKRFV